MKYWLSRVPHVDDLGRDIDDTFIDGATVLGPWAIMAPASFKTYGLGLGTGKGQKYTKQTDGRWLKTEG